MIAIAMSPIAIEFIAAFAVPLIILVALRINAAMVFLSMCLGYVLVEFVANDADSLINFIAPNRNSITASTLRLAMLFIPAILTSLIMLFSIKGRLRVTLNVLPAAGAAVLAVVFAVPQLPIATMAQLQAEPLWQQFTKFQALLIGAGAILSLLFLWTQRRNARHAEEGKHHH